MADHLGPYELRGELGRGAMAVVWRAWDPALEREVAIKEPMIPPGLDAETAAELTARFVREGKAAAGLNHRGIVTIYVADVYEGRPAIVMELIKGETLSEVLARGPLSPGGALAVLDQLLDAVGYAHSRGVVHRDIKPDNVFVTVDGRVKLADFGIAHVGTSSALTQAGTVMGTPGYMAPEQVTGQPVDARADVFAIGALAYEMLTGLNPFGAGAGVATTTVMYRIVHEPMPQLPGQLTAALPEPFSRVLSAAVAKDPADRFADAAAFRSALAGGPITSSRGSRASWVTAAAGRRLVPGQSARASRNWTTWFVGGTALLVAGALVAFLGSRGTNTGRTTQTVTKIEATATPMVQVPPTPAEDRAAIVALCDAYLKACAEDDVRAGYDMYTTTFKRRTSFEVFQSQAKPDADSGTDNTAFIRGFVSAYNNQPLTVEPETLKFVSLNSASATITYEHIYGVEAFFQIRMTLVKEVGTWRIDDCRMQTAAGA